MTRKETKLAACIIPQNGYVLCRRIAGDSAEVQKNGFVCSVPQMPVYEVLKTSGSQSQVRAGDHIICNSKGTQVQVDDESLWLFKQESIAAKLREED